MSSDERREVEGGDSGASTEGEVLSEMEKTALQVVAAGRSHAVAAETVGRSTKWVQRLLHKPEARDLVTQLRRGRLDEVSGILSSGAAKAAQVIEQLLESENESMRLRAAQVLLTQTRDHVALDDLRLVAQQLESEMRAMRDEEAQD